MAANPMLEDKKRYDVALSFAGEDRALAAGLAQRLQDSQYTVFFDEYERAELWGADLAEKLQRVYEHESRFCVPFVSKVYLQKPWTKQERQYMLSRAVKEAEPYILPIRVDDVDLPGLPGNTAYLDLRHISIDEVFPFLQTSWVPGPVVTRHWLNGSRNRLSSMSTRVTLLRWL